MPIPSSSESDPRYHSSNIRRMLDERSRHVREDATQVRDPRAQALFAAAAEARRAFLRRVGAAGAGIVLLGFPPIASGAEAAGDAELEEEEVTANEDLMREHGVLKRALLIYREAIRRVDGRQEMPPGVLADTAKLIRRFVEEYHEKQEEDYLFPRFERAGQQVELVRTLRLQHQRGRERTAAIIQLATPVGLKDAESRARLVSHMAAFIRMYEPHEAREDTVLFPAFRKLVSRNEYDSLGEELERNERRIFGGDGFDMAVDTVASLEKKLGTYDLAQFTPAALARAPS